MMRYCVLGWAVCCAVLPAVLRAQPHEIDSLKLRLHQPDKLTLADTVAVQMLNKLASLYRLRSSDSSLYYSQRAAQLSDQLNYPKGKLYAMLNQLSIYGGYNISTSNLDLLKRVADSAMQLAKGLSEPIKADAYLEVGRAYSARIDKEQGLKTLFAALESYERLGDKMGMAKAWYYIALVHHTNESYQEALLANQHAVRFMQEVGDQRRVAIILNNLALNFESLKQADTAIYIWKTALATAEACNEVQALWSAAANLARAYVQKQQYAEAEHYILLSLQAAKTYPARYASSLAIKGRIHLAKGEAQLALQCAKESFDIHKETQAYAMRESLELLAESYAKIGNFKEAYFFQKQYAQFQDSAYAARKAESITELQSQYNLAKKNQEIELLQRDREKETLLRHALVGGVGLSTMLATVALWGYVANRNKKNLLAQKNAQLGRTLQELQMAQAQLIAQEKLAALGELTAGVAHELQNPLNFVQNFASLSKDLALELKSELNQQEHSASANELAERIVQATEKTEFHSMRASNIVKAMIQQARRTASEKEPTDLNALLKSYTTIAYQTYCAKHPDFCATLRYELNSALPLVKVSVSDLAHALLSITQRALAEVHRKAKQLGSEMTLEPELLIYTALESENIRISIRDSGNVMGEEEKQKLFQPVVSMSKDESNVNLGLYTANEIVRANGGRIEVESRAGVGTELSIILPKQ
jgi:two-component system NtrC family sensor kinase